MAFRSHCAELCSLASERAIQDDLLVDRLLVPCAYGLPVAAVERMQQLFLSVHLVAVVCSDNYHCCSLDRAERGALGAMLACSVLTCVTFGAQVRRQHRRRTDAHKRSKRIIRSRSKPLQPDTRPRRSGEPAVGPLVSGRYLCHRLSFVVVSVDFDPCA